MPKRIDLTGQKFHRLTVIEFAKTVNHNSVWKCVCDCGKERLVYRSSLLTGNTKSCGCFGTDYRTKVKTTHGMSTSNECSIWYAIRSRCYSPNVSSFPDYGGRGIKMCDRWKESFENFYSDMGKRPTNRHSIDRIDVNGDYTPENCRWATDMEQGANRRDNHWVEYNGVRMIISDLGRLLGVNIGTLSKRIKKYGYENAISKYQRQLESNCKESFNWGGSQQGSVSHFVQ